MSRQQNLYIGPYFIAPRVEVTAPVHYGWYCEACDTVSGQHANFCSHCGLAVQNKWVDESVPIPFHKQLSEANMEPSLIWQPSNDRTVISNRSDIGTHGCGIERTTYMRIDIDLEQRSEEIEEFAQRVSPLLKYYEKIGVEIPKIEYGVYLYYC